MTITKFNLTSSKEDIFYKIIYPIHAHQFMFGKDYEQFANLINANFILNPEQWQYILEHWEAKESIKQIEQINN